METAINPQYPILLVDDEENFLLSAEFTLGSNGMNNVMRCLESTAVMPMLSEREFSAVVLDITMPKKSGTELLPVIRDEYPNVPVVMVTAVNEVETAVKCMKMGAFDYLVKPIDDTRLITTLRRAIELKEVKSENVRLKKYLLSDELEQPDAFEAIITQDPKMRSIFQYIEAIGGTSLPVLITGETGVGKELVAKALHNVSSRSGEFVPVNVAGVDDNLFSDTLFGHKKGGFTGADTDRKGLIEQATGGTLFLDEIGDLSFESQVKLLRLLQEGKYYALGSDVPKLTDARMIVATNADIDKMQREGRFRKDLFYRLQAHHIHVPTLRERKDDLPLLLDHFLSKAAAVLKKKKPTPPKELLTLLRNYSYPGNVRELEGMVFDALSRHKSGILSMSSFKDKIAPNGVGVGITEDDGQSAEESTDEVIFPENLPTLKSIEQMLINEALKRSDGNQTIAAQMLGLTRRALNNRLSRA